MSRTKDNFRVKFLASASLITWACVAASPALAASDAGDVKALVERLERLEAANAKLQAEVRDLRSSNAPEQAVEPVTPYTPAPMLAPAQAPAATASAASVEPQRAVRNSSVVGINPAYGYAILDHAEGVNQRLLMQLNARRDGKLTDMVTLSGGVTVIANAQFSNRKDKFGYLMRHPTPNNQRTKATQDLAVSSAQLAATFLPEDYVTGYVEMLYDPQQSFASGTLTALARNQVQVRKAYVMVGNLAKSPFYVAIGKMDVPFGLQDTVSPFTNSTNWHAFAPLAYGGQVGYSRNGVNVRVMALMGGAQFRSANTPVDGTAVPAKVNNFTVDGSYTLSFNDTGTLRVGGSYIHGSAYCQGYPVFHFNPCADNVPAWSAYGQLDMGRLRLIGELARTTKVWPGTQVPDPRNPLSQFAASRVTAFTVGGRYLMPVLEGGSKVSVEYSKFIAGPEGAPWQRQDQLVVGLSHRLSPSVDLGGEYIRVNGFAPLNFVSGGNFTDGSTWSDSSAQSNVLMLALQAAF